LSVVTLSRGHQLCQGHGIAEVEAMIPELARLVGTGEIEGSVEAGAGFRIECHPGDPGAHPQQPEGEPSALETGVAGDQHAPTVPEGRIRTIDGGGHQLQSFQGA
jgi:hypothetical protein